MLAGRAKVEVVGLAFGEVVVYDGACQRRNQRHDRRKRYERAEASDKRSVSHRTVAIIA